MAPYGSIKIMEDRTDEYVATNLMRYAWVFNLYTHFYPLGITRPAEFLGKISTILENMKIQENPDSGMNKILQRTTDYLKHVLAVKPLKSQDVISDKEYDDFLTSMRNERVPNLSNGDTLKQTTIIPSGFGNSMKFVVSTITEGCIFATAKIEIFCNLQKAVGKRISNQNARQQICKFKGFEMVYEILDRSYLK